MSLGADDARMSPGSDKGEARPFAYQHKHTVYLPTLSFDRMNRMHVFWNWRVGEAGMTTVRPSYAWSQDQQTFFDAGGAPVELPISFSAATPVAGLADAEEYYAPKSALVHLDSAPAVVMAMVKGGRRLWSLDRETKRFSAEELPLAASEVVADEEGGEWAFATGLKVFKRSGKSERWQFVADIGKDLCNPRAIYAKVERTMYLHAKSCDGSKAFIYRFGAQR